MKKKATYIFLPTNELSKEGGICDTAYGFSISGKDGVGMGHHIYILGDFKTLADKCKPGEWKYCSFTDQIAKYDCFAEVPGTGWCEDCRKIIGTTNPDLHNKKNPNHNEDSYVVDVPSISLPDVVHIISLHNDKTKPSNSIMVEYENVNSGWQQLANDGKRGSTIVPDNLVPKLDKQGNITLIRD